MTCQDTNAPRQPANAALHLSPDSLVSEKQSEKEFRNRHSPLYLPPRTHIHPHTYTHTRIHLPIHVYAPVTAGIHPTSSNTLRQLHPPIQHSLRPTVTPGKHPHGHPRSSSHHSNTPSLTSFPQDSTTTHQKLCGDPANFNEARTTITCPECLSPSASSPTGLTFTASPYVPVHSVLSIS